MDVQTAAAPVGVQWPIKHVALAVDGTDEAKRAVAYTAQLAKAAGAEVTVLHFREVELNRFGGPAAMESTEEIGKLIADAVRELTEAGLTVSSDVGNATPLGEARPVVRSAEKVGADLIVVGTRGFSTGRALVQGSVAHDLIHAARIPVLVIH
jgi:nucleotide-binding universal stress UspA family protein